MIQNNFDPAILVFAAGKSQRFGANKMLARLANGKSVIQQTCETLKQLERQFLVVANTNSIETCEALEKLSIGFVAINTHGLGESIAKGVALTESQNGWLVCLADLPFIQVHTYKHMLNAIVQHQKKIIRPVCERIPGHPVYFPQDLFEELHNLSGDHGAKEIVARHKDKLKYIDVDDKGVLSDIDTPSDLQD